MFLIVIRNDSPPHPLHGRPEEVGDEDEDSDGIEIDDDEERRRDIYKVKTYTVRVRYRAEPGNHVDQDRQEATYMFLMCPECRGLVLKQIFLEIC